MEAFTTSFFWITLGQIIMINIVLSGDNAVVIALASRSLPPAQQKKAIFLGSFGAIILRVILTFFAVLLLGLPYLKIVGAALLGWIGIKMLLPDDGEEEIDASTQLWAAVKTIIVADLIMSLDNVLGVAAAAKGSLLLLIIGLGISIPIIIYGSTLVLKMMTRWPIIITAGRRRARLGSRRDGRHRSRDRAVAAGPCALAARARPRHWGGDRRRGGQGVGFHVPPDLRTRRWSAHWFRNPLRAMSGPRPMWSASHDGTKAVDPTTRVAVPISSRIPAAGRWRALFESWKAQRTRPG
jgi:YjbE family integral membrane protein